MRTLSWAGICLFVAGTCLTASAQINSVSEGWVHHVVQLPDLDGDGIPELAGYRNQAVAIWSGRDYSWIRNVTLGNNNYTGQMIVGPDFGGEPGPDLYIGSVGEQVEGESRGAVLVRDPQTGAALHQINSPTPVQNGGFGSSLAFLGDQLLVGAAGEGESGRVHVLAGNDFSAIAALDSPNAGSSGSFGLSVLAIDDVNDDGVQDFVVCAPGEKIGTRFDAGRVYVYSGAGRSVLHTLDRASPIPGERFGEHVVATGDLSGDGINDLAVITRGASRTVGPALLFFSGEDGSLIDSIEFVYGQGESNYHAAGMELLGDVNGDGVEDLALLTSNAKVHIFSLADRTPIHVATPLSSILEFAALDSAEGGGKKDLLLSHGPFGAGGAKLYSIEPRLAATPGLVRHRSPVGGSSTQRVALRNDGLLPVVLELPVVPSGSDAAAYAHGVPTPLEYGGGAVGGALDITFAPHEGGSHTATVSLHSNSANSPLVLELAGEGIPYQPEDGLNKVYLSVADSVYTVDLTTGDRELLSKIDDGYGHAGGIHGGIAVEDDDHLLSASFLEVVRIHRATGHRTLLHPIGSGSGVSPVGRSSGLRVKGPNQVHLSMMDGILDIDLGTQTRSWLSWPFKDLGVGSGPGWLYLGPIEEESPGALLAGDGSVPGLFRVDRTTGDRTLIADAADGLPGPVSIASLNGGDIAIATAGRSLHRVHGTTGTVTRLTDANVDNPIGGGDPMVKARAVAYAAGARKLIVYDIAAKALLRVDPTTGDRTIFSGGPANIGSGPPFPSITHSFWEVAHLAIAEAAGAGEPGGNAWWLY